MSEINKEKDFVNGSGSVDEVPQKSGVVPSLVVEIPTSTTNTNNDSSPSCPVLHSPIPHKPGSVTSSIHNQSNINSSSAKPLQKPQPTINENPSHESTPTTIDRKASTKKGPPLLKVKTDPNLKSCLSPSTIPLTGDHIKDNLPSLTSTTTTTTATGTTSVASILGSNIFPQTAESILTTDNAGNLHIVSADQHPSFLVQSDNISPNKHGLLHVNEKGTATPIVDEIHAQSHINFTPLVNSNSLSRNSVSPPILNTSNNGNIPFSTTSGTSSPPPIPSRMNSLRYIDHDDKRYIESLRHSNNSSLSSSAAGTNSNDEKHHQVSSPSSELDLINQQQQHQQQFNDNKLHLLIAITGCISIHKNIFLIIEKLFELYTHDKLEIQVILTKSAEWFLSDKLYKFEQFGVKVWFSDDDAKYFLTSPFQKHIAHFQALGTSFKPRLNPNVLSQYFLAYNLQRWTDVLLICPLSANTMAKLISGLSDNLVTNLLHVWPIPQGSSQYQQQVPPPHSSVSPHDSTIITNNVLSPKPIVAALALTNAMYAHPITKKQVSLLKETYPNMSILKPVEKCVTVDGSITMGGMRSWSEIVDIVSQKLGRPSVDEEDDDDDDDEGEQDEQKDEIKDKEEDEEEGEADGDEDEDEDSTEEKIEIKKDSKTVPVIKEEDENQSDEAKPVSIEKKAAAKTKKDKEIKLVIKEEQTNGGRRSSLTPIISTDATLVPQRSRHNTVSRKELQEHERLALENAKLNAGIGIS
ncbi:uncharacterized protein RJT21DRAFT_137319 [Scheffersomyces amazonensis]|uniref:uncharacterized protein n=1 Tax=Scheffersomyces amazonensis TaxID=1078765 RepID=UPI00315D2066